jgi:hypothetical protein
MKWHRMASITRGIVLVAPGLAAIYVAAIPGMTPPHGGLAAAAAVREARSHADPGAHSVASAVVRHDVIDQSFPGPPIHRWVWLVTFSGQWYLLCSGTSDGCNPTTEWVAVDYYTGTWVRSEYSYPA